MNLPSARTRNYCPAPDIFLRMMSTSAVALKIIVISHSMKWELSDVGGEDGRVVSSGVPVVSSGGVVSSGTLVVSSGGGVVSSGISVVVCSYVVVSSTGVRL